MKLVIIFIAAVWVSISEFVRNEFIFKALWTEHYESLGLTFVTLPEHGVLWLVWSLIFAYVLFEIQQNFSFKKTVFLMWLFSFVQMWIVVFNLQMLPLALLPFAIPLSVLEIVIALFLVKKLQHKTIWF